MKTFGCFLQIVPARSGVDRSLKRLRVLAEPIPRASPENRAFIAYWPPAETNNQLKLAVKDNIDMKGVVTTASSKRLARNVVAEGWVAKFVNFTVLHEPYHGVHHWRTGLPHPELPEHAAALEPSVEEERPPFRTFGAAVRDLFIHLADTRVGAQWLGVSRTTPKNG